jgi:energy-coupling factor transporter transmembrane protein EcfT
MQSGMINYKEEQNSRYFTFLILFIVVSFLFLVWILIISAGIIIFEFDQKWALLSLDTWIYIAVVFILFFIFLELMLYFGYNNGNHKIGEEKPNQKYIDDKKLYVYTYPKEAKGGIFSKTYILIDENSVLNLRCLMISPGELWDQKET